MPIVSDQHGTREVSDAELAEMVSSAEARWKAFWYTLEWRPIGAFDRASEVAQLLRAGGDWVFGYWGRWPAHAGEPEAGDPGTDTWRHAQDCVAGLRIDFEPTEFAIVADDDWRADLLAD